MPMLIKIVMMIVLVRLYWMIEVSVQKVTVVIQVTVIKIVPVFVLVTQP